MYGAFLLKLYIFVAFRQKESDNKRKKQEESIWVGEGMKEGKRSIVGTSTQAAAPYRAAYKSVCFLHSAGSLSDHGSRSSQNPVS